MIKTYHIKHARKTYESESLKKYYYNKSNNRKYTRIIKHEVFMNITNNRKKQSVHLFVFFGEKLKV